MVEKIIKCFVLLLLVVNFVVLAIVIVKLNNIQTSSVSYIGTELIEQKRDSLKIKVEHLDSIKNAKIVEVEGLDNDSTLKLFYKLIE